MRRLLILSIDSADPTLVRKWADQGELPALAGLMREGATASLESISNLFPDAAWPTIATGCLPGKHGHYNWRCVRPGTTTMAFAPARSYLQPFWLLAARSGRDVLTFDMQGSFVEPEAGGTQIVGWGQRAARVHESWPPGLFGELEAQFGRPPQWLDDDVVNRGVRSAARYLSVLERSVAARTEVLLQLLRDRPWDLCVASYQEAHNGGHVFHRYVHPSHWAHDAGPAKRFGGALLEIQKLIDRGIATLLESLPPDTDVVLFSGTGFRANSNGLQILPKALIGLGYTVPRTASPLPQALNMVSRAIPWSIRRHVNRRLSNERQSVLLARMWEESIDWTRTRAVAETAFSAGWVRINLRGREPHGIVEPGSEYDELCVEIADELRALRNAETGAPAVAEVVRMDGLADGPRAREFPDLYVRWAPDRFLRAATHPRLELVRENMRDVAVSEHSGEGFLVAAGPSIRSGGDIRGHVVDVAATALYMTGAPIPSDMDGNVLTELIDPEELARRPVVRVAQDWRDEPWP
ncbi:MAG: hypothetical protein QOH02_737 [Gaiellaceae bacterium]|nr:hypothetical protein [Gaiellaceae bacterium]